MTAGELRRILIGLIAKSHFIQEFKGDLFGLLFRHLAHLNRCQGEVLQHRHIFKKIEVLENHPDFGANPVNVGFVIDFFAIDIDVPFGRLLQVRDAAQKRTLTRARGPDDHDHFTIFNFHIHLGQDHVVAEGFFQVFNFDHWICISFPNRPLNG